MIIFCPMFIIFLMWTRAQSSLCPSCQPGQTLTAFEESLQVLINRHLGLRNTQTQFSANNDRIEIRQKAVDLQSRITQIAGALAVMIYKRKAMLTAIEQQLQRMAQASSVNQLRYDLCCNVSTPAETENNDMEYSSVYKTTVDINSICMYEADEFHESAINVTRELLDTFQSNRRQHPLAGWQHVYIIGAGYYMYPKVRTNSCDMEIVRVRPWYHQLTIPVIELVILIDRSMPMANNSQLGKSLLSVAKDIALTLIYRHSIRSKIAVISFSNGTNLASTNSSCYATKCVYATPFNKAVLNNFVNDIVADMSVTKSSYYAALEKARDVLHESDASNPVIMWLTTDVDPIETRQEILQHINDTVLAFPEIHIITMNIGTGNTRNATSLLQDMARSPSPTIDALYMHMTQLKKHRMDLFPVFHYLSSYVQPTILHVSTPYHNRDSNDTIWTISLPVIFRNRLIAVAGVDVFLSEVLHKLNFFKHTHTQYFFIMHVLQNYTMAHPHLSLPKHENQIVYVDIKYLESDAYNAGIIDAIVKKTDGNMTIDVVRNIPRGDTYREGYRTITTPTAYIWKSFPTLPFAVAFVTTHLNYLHLVSKSADAVPFGNIQYKKNANLCRHFGRVSIADYTTIHWSPSTFIHPVKRMATNETLTVLKKYHKILSKKLNNSVFVDGVVDSAQVVRAAHEHWTRHQHSDFALKRYLAFASGIMIVFPGSWRDRSSNPLAMGWYKNAALFPDSTAVSMPYLDPDGAGDIVTISKTVSLQDSNGQSQTVLGVMGIDITISYLRARLRERFTRCKHVSVSCFLVDTSGYIVIHDEMFLPPRQGHSPRIHNVHITALEPHIASDLLQRGNMKRISCINLLKMHTHYMYSIEAPDMIDKFDRYPFYRLGHVPNSNIFMVVKNKNELVANDANCTCILSNETIPECVGNFSCQCPCVQTGDNFNHCKHEMDGNWTSCEDDEAYSLHFPSMPQYDTIEQKIAALSSIPHCYKYDCDKQLTSDKCDLLSGCKWCTTDSDGNQLANAYCGEYSTCFYGQVGYPNPYGYDIPHWQEGTCDTRCIIIRVVSSIAVFASAVLLSVIIYIIIDKLREMKDAPTVALKDIATGNTIKISLPPADNESDSGESFESLESAPEYEAHIPAQSQSQSHSNVSKVTDVDTTISQWPSLEVALTKELASIHSGRSERRRSSAKEQF